MMIYACSAHVVAHVRNLLYLINKSINARTCVDAHHPSPLNTTLNPNLNPMQVLCASNDTHDSVDPIIPPEGVPVGERVAFEGYSNDPLPEVRLRV